MLAFLKKIWSLFRRSPSEPINPTRETPPSVVITDASGVKIPHVILGTLDCFEKEKVIVYQAFEMLNIVLASETFKQKVLSAKFTETNGKSSQGIYSLLCAQAIKIDIVVFTGSFYQNRVVHTIGYETVPGVVNINRYYVTTPFEFADNIAHEICHSIGFSHLQVKETSVPYVMNTIFEECVKEMAL
jgi:hypothetical protein